MNMATTYFCRFWIFFAFGLLCLKFGDVESKSLNRLSPMIAHFEPLLYDREAFHANHERVKRSTTEGHTLSISAFGRDMNLVLERDHRAISQNLQITSSTGTVQYDSQRLYRGYVEGDEESSLYGIVTQDRTFEGRIRTKDEIYLVERASKYFKEGAAGFHSVIYRDSDVERHKIKGDKPCASEALYEKQKQMFSKDKAVRDNTNNENVAKENVAKENVAKEGEFSRRADDGEGPGGEGTYQESKARKKRAIDDTKQQCNLYIQADYTYYEYWGSNELTVIDEIIAHVAGANAIYELVDFDGDAAGAADGINFIVDRIHIWTDQADSAYKFQGSFSVESFLTTFSEDETWDEYCLVYMFNHRDFDGGTLGLAWTGDLDTDGGVCEDSARYSGTRMSLNSGLITNLNYGNVSPQAISIITFAHELGHNMGSPHDTDGDATCAPGGSVGNYIMYAHATSGDKENNNQFSSCSITAMHNIMERDARDEDTGCFEANVASVCGNRILEDGEACDCGHSDQCTDTCCDADTCALTPGASCSPANDPCCEPSCDITTAESDTECRAQTACLASAVCDGENSTCPDSANAEDGTYCNDAQNVCIDGECSGSLCFRANMTQCQCEGSGWSADILCFLCCSPNGDGSNCMSSYELEEMNGTLAQSGYPCKNYKGYCDSLNTCRRYNPESSFRALADLFTKEGIKTLSKWLKNNWYIPVSATVAFVIMLVVLIKFGVPKKKSDKKKKQKEKEEKEKREKEKEKKGGKGKVGPGPRQRGPPPPRKDAFSPPKKR